MLISSRMEAVQSVLVVSGAVLSWNVRLVDERGRPSTLVVVSRGVSRGVSPVGWALQKGNSDSREVKQDSVLWLNDVIIRQVHPNRSAKAASSETQVSFHQHLLHKHKEARERSDGLHGIRTISYTQQHTLSQCQVYQKMPLAVLRPTKTLSFARASPLYACPMDPALGWRAPSRRFRQGPWRSTRPS